MADYKKRKKDPPWAEAFDRGEITPEQSRKILADIEFNQQMALADKHARAGKGWGALAKGVIAADTVTGLAFPLKGAVKAGAKLGKKLIGKTGKKGERPDAPFRKSTDKEAEWYRGELDKTPAGKYHGNQQRVKGENVRQYYMRTSDEGLGSLQPWRPPGFKEGLGAGALGGGAAGMIIENKANKVRKESEARKQLKKSITRKATKKKPKTYWPEDFGDLDAEEAKAMGKFKMNYDDID